MEHIWYPSGAILPAQQGRPLKLYGGFHPYGDISVRCHVALPEAIVLENQIPDFRTEFEFEYESVASARILKHSLKKREVPNDLTVHLLDVIRDPSVLLRSPTGPMLYQLINYVEQTPNPTSRIGLSEQKDA
ncbi:MAG: hypothetical protein ACREV4_15150 [Gammaproteobacteria bacterium]